MACDLERPVTKIRGENGFLSRSVEGDREQVPTHTVAPPPVKPPRVRPAEPSATLIRSALVAALSRVQAADPEARRGEVEGIHRLRTSTRRLRSELRTVRDLIDQVSREQLEDELKWLADALGSVRDLDILRDRLHAAALACIGEKGQGDAGSHRMEDRLQPLFRSFENRREAGSRALRDALAGDRYRNLVATLGEWIVHPPLRDEAWAPCRTTLPALGLAAWKRLKKGARALSKSGPEEEFHEVRKRAKRARYTAELIAPTLGSRIEKKAKRFIRLTTKVQDILGEHQDAVVAASEVERFLAESDQGRDEAVRRDAHALLESQRRAAQAARLRFFDCWNRLDRKKSTRWLKLKLKNRSLA